MSAAGAPRNQFADDFVHSVDHALKNPSFEILVPAKLARARDAMDLSTPAEIAHVVETAEPAIPVERRSTVAAAAARYIYAA